MAEADLLPRARNPSTKGSLRRTYGHVRNVPAWTLRLSGKSERPYTPGTTMRLSVLSRAPRRCRAHVYVIVTLCLIRGLFVCCSHRRAGVSKPFVAFVYLILVSRLYTAAHHRHLDTRAGATGAGPNRTTAPAPPSPSTITHHPLGGPPLARGFGTIAGPTTNGSASTRVALTRSSRTATWRSSAPLSRCGPCTRWAPVPAVSPTAWTKSASRHRRSHGAFGGVSGVCEALSTFL